MTDTNAGSRKMPVDLPLHGRRLDACLAVPSSKSLTNRGLVMSAVADGGEVVKPLECEDTALLRLALERCGWRVELAEDCFSVGARVVPEGPVRADLGNSGTGSRFLLALAAVSDGETVVDGSPRLRERPMGPLIRALRQLDVNVDATGEHLPATVHGGHVSGGWVVFAPRSSSQFVSALLLVAPLMKQGLELRLEGPLPSTPYLRLTRSVLERFGAEINNSDDLRWWRVEPGGVRPAKYVVEGDWSAAAFPFAAAAVAGGRVTVTNLRGDSLQGDRLVLDVLEDAGCRVGWNGDGVTVVGPTVGPVRADLSGSPDLFPALAVVAACGPPGSEITGLGTLRHKESNRLQEMANNLGGLGAKVLCSPDRFDVKTPVAPGGGTHRAVTAANDHRIAMAMAVAALRAGPLRLDDGACVTKSYPDFWRDWIRLRSLG